jgi:hypothetical protein
MARAKQVKARKDYPQQGIKKGDLYWTADIKTGPRSGYTLRSKTQPKRWQLTTSSFNQAIWQIEDEGFDNITCAEDLRAVAEQIREAGQEAQDSFDNMPEGLQQGETGQLLEQRASDCDEWADAIDEAADELENALDDIQKAAEAKVEWDAHWQAIEELEQDESATDAQMDALIAQEPDSEDPGEDWDEEDTKSQALTEFLEQAKDANPGNF